MKKQVGHRIGALLLTFALTIGGVPLAAASSTADRIYLSKAQAEAYYQVLQEMVEQYGICPTDDTNGVRGGVAYVKIVDFDRDGSPELLTIYNHDYHWTWKIYSYKDGALSEFSTLNSEEEWAMGYDINVCYSGDSLPLLTVSYGYGGSGGSTYQTDVYSFSDNTLSIVAFCTTGYVNAHPELSEIPFCTISDNGVERSYEDNSEAVAGFYEKYGVESTDFQHMIAFRAGSGITDEAITDDEIPYFLQRLLNPGPSYSFPQVTDTLTEDQVAAIAKTVANYLGGTVTGIYKLADDLYYVIITLNDGGTGGAVVKETHSGFRVIQSGAALLPEEELAPYIAEATKQSNVTIDYDKITDFTTVEDFTNYLDEILGQMDGTMPNAPAKNLLATYVETAVSKLTAGTIYATQNQVTVGGEYIRAGVTSADDIKAQLEYTLSEQGIALNKTVTIIFRIEGLGVDLSAPAQITFDRSLLEAMGSAAAIQLLLGDHQHSIKLSAESLKTLVNEYGMVIVQIECSDGSTYRITFVDSEGNPIEKLPADITFTLPADSELSTVLATYKGGSDNWGGQFDTANKTIEFATKFSGQYEVLKSKTIISDIDSLSEDVKNTIYFMVSKGYFALEDGAFQPERSLTRYDFTKALVRMFFALDRSLTTSFPDVPKGSEYYPYVASAQSGSIVAGYDDGTFSGDKSITWEQVLTLCARTLVEKKEYVYPEHPEEYLAHIDSENLSSWAREAVALAVREGLAPVVGTVDPRKEITRAESAEILYRLFMLLYETSPVAFEADSNASENKVNLLGSVEEPDVENTETEHSFPVLPMAVGGGVVILIGAIGFFAIRKKQIESQKSPEKKDSSIKK